jgi:hypothetical protein
VICRLCHQPAGLKLHTPWARLLASIPHLVLHALEAYAAPLILNYWGDAAAFLVCISRFGGLVLVLFFMADALLLFSLPVLAGTAPIALEQAPCLQSKPNFEAVKRRRSCRERYFHGLQLAES